VPERAPRAAGLSSELVRLEPVGPAEVSAILRGTPDPGLSWEDGFPSQALLAFIRQAGEDDGLLGPFFAYLIVREPDGLVVGDAGFHGPPGPEGEVEIGYALVPAARGAGLATEAVRLLARWALDQPAVIAVVARVDAHNEFADRSESLLLGLGFTADGESDGMRRLALRTLRI